MVFHILAIVPLWERAKPILQAQPEYDPTKANPGDLMGRVALDHVTFRYRDDGLPILNHISLYADPGEFVAIVGPSGGGKSTILRLLLGFETPQKGTVYYDNLDLAQLDLQAVSKKSKKLPLTDHAAFG
ncbi:MAG: ATP-binding cassette domain-containing protein [Stigonema ocellatum SAG 48.90 = DSM 106950]|nr:ATP-binding cassette domain-containing protein [Stigonema ocellatum SAG 48.90 = DSM 106950]